MKTRFRVYVVLLVVALVIPALAHAPKTQVFSGSVEQVFNAAVTAAQQDWSVTHVDRETHTFSFTTGTSVTTWGMDCSGFVEQADSGHARVTLRAQKKNQVFAWGAGDRIASKLFTGIEGELAKQRPR